VAPDHPSRLIRTVVDEALGVLSPEFDRLYPRVGRFGIAPEKLLRALLLLAFYSIRSERQLMEQLNYNLLFRWFVGLSMDAPVWDASTFSKNRDRLQDGEVAQRLLAAVVAQPRIKAFMSQEHFCVDGTLIQAWTSHKSFQPKPGSDAEPPPSNGPEAPPAGRNAERNWRGQRRSNETHASITDPDARLARKSDGRANIMAYADHVLMGNHNVLVAQSCLTHATGTAARDAAPALVDRMAPGRRITLGADKSYDVAAFIAALRARRVTPHVAVDCRVSKLGKRRGSGVDQRRMPHAGNAASQRVRKRIKEVFGWIKGSTGLRRTKHHGCDRAGWQFELAITADNLIRLPKLLTGVPT